MDRADIVSAVTEAGVPCAFGWYKQGNEPARPYAVLNYLFDDDLMADNEPYLERERWQLDIVSDTRSEGIEKKVEGSLRALGLALSKSGISDMASESFRAIYRFTTN